MDAISLLVGLPTLSMGILVDSPQRLHLVVMGAVCMVPTILRAMRVVELPAPLVVLIVTSSSLHGYGLLFDLYDETEWFDNITHTLSSMTVGIIVFYAVMCIQYYSGSKVNFTGRGLTVITALISLSFGVYWEVMEYVLDSLTTSVAQYSPYDTVTDLVWDSMGALLASLWVHRYMRGRDTEDVVESFRLNERLKSLATAGRDRPRSPSMYPLQRAIPLHRHGLSQPLTQKEPFYTDQKVAISWSSRPR